MATSKAAVTLRGRFSPGSTVRLIEVKDESVLRPEGGKEIDTKTVDKDGTVSFTTGVTAGGRYFISGLIDGFPRDVRVTGREDADADIGAQAPIGFDRVRLSDGSFVDEAPKDQDPSFGGIGPAPSQQQARGVEQRSATPRGYAHPVDAKQDEPPYPRQEDVPDDTQQRSATPTGMATPIAHEAAGSQSQVRKGTQQRSDTPMGYATPIPSGDAVDAMRVRESSQSKAEVGEPVKAAGNPPSNSFKQGPDPDPAVIASLAVREGLISPGAPVDGETSTGHDAQGQPVYDDLARQVGIDPAGKPQSEDKKS